MKYNHKVVNATDLRSIGAMISSSINTTVTIGGEYFDGNVMHRLDGCADVPALEGLAGVFWNLKAADVSIKTLDGKIALLPSAGRVAALLRQPVIVDVETDTEVVYDAHGLGVSQCRIVNDFAVPETVPLVVAVGALRRLPGRTNVYITPHLELCHNNPWTRLLKVS